MTHSVELVVGAERRVARHEEVQARRRDQRRHQTDQVVVHVRRVPAAGGGISNIIPFSNLFFFN